jgi:transposase
MKYVMDKGFYSEKNIEKLLGKHIRFTISFPFNNKFAKEKVDAVQGSINNYENSISINNDIVYAHTTVIKIKRYRYTLFIMSSITLTRKKTCIGK